MELVHTRDLQFLQPNWCLLWRQGAGCHPFQTPAWLLPWARHFAPDRTRAVAVRANDALIAFAPFFTWRGSLLLAGTGPSDYAADLFAPARAEAAPLLLAALCEAARECDCHRIDLQQLSALSPLLHAKAPPGWRHERLTGTVCPTARLTGNDGLGEVSRAWQKNIARAERMLQRTADLELGLADATELASAVDLLAQLHSRRWCERDGSVVFSDPAMHAFMRDVLGELHAAGLLRLQRLRIAGQTIALVIAMHCGDAAYFYMVGFDPAWSRFSPGLVTIAAAMRQAASEGAHEFHFLRGREAYKYHLGARDRPTYRRVLRRIAAGRQSAA